MRRTHLFHAALLGMLATTTVAAQKLDPALVKQIHHSTLHNVHAVGKVLSAGSASGDDGKMHFMVAVTLATPLPGGVTEIAATVTHNEPPKAVQISIGTHSGNAGQVDTVDVTCPVVNVISFHGVTNAFGEECTFNGYSGS